MENAFDDIDFKGGQLEIDSGIDLYHDGITLVLYGPAARSCWAVRQQDSRRKRP